MAYRIPIINSFNGGEWSPALKGRTDLEKYYNACQTCENFIPLVYGPVTRRPGTKYVAEVKNSSDETRLIPFIYSDETTFVLEFGDQYIRFYTSNAQVQDGASPLEVSTPWSASEVQELDYAQINKVMYLAHGSYKPRKLTYNGSTWTLTEIDFYDGPYRDTNTDEDIFLTASARSGTITVNAVDSAGAAVSLFDSNQVGSLWRARQDRTELSVTSNTQGDTTTAVKIYGKFNVDIINKSGDWVGKITLQRGTYVGGVASWHDWQSFYGTANEEFFETERDIYWRLVHTRREDGQVTVSMYQDEAWGVVEITGYTSSDEVTANVIVQMPGTQSTELWEEGSWSAYRGWPEKVTFFENRLWFARTDSEQQTVWSSWVDDYENFQPGNTDDAPMTYTLLSDQANPIQWMVPKNEIIVGTIGNEWRLGLQSPTEPLTAENVRANRETTHGSANVKPVLIGTQVLFVQQGSRKIRELIYSFETDSWVADDITQLAEHLTNSGIKEISYQQEPYNLVWVVLNNGDAIAMTYARNQKVWGWSKHTTDGSFESIATIPADFSADESQDQVWFIVNRTIDGSTKRYIEYLESNYNEDVDTQEDFYHVDCGITYDGAATTTITGLDHLEGETVQVYADGANHGDKTVSGGSISLDYSASTVQVGLGFDSIIQTMPLEVGGQGYSSRGQQKQIFGIIFIFKDAATCKLGTATDNLETLPFRDAFDAYDTATALYSGEYPWTSPGPWGTDTAPMIKVDTPTPLTLLAIIPEVESND